MTNSIKNLLKEECREFWIVRSTDMDLSAAGFVYVRESGHPKEIHVIEASYAHRLKEALEKCVKENEELHTKYSLIELANKEWTKNDHVNFGKLMTENEELKEALEKCILERDFILEYLNPSDTSFRNMMDDFRQLSKDQKNKLIGLSRSLAAIAESK
jgi:hypothetical protein